MPKVEQVDAFAHAFMMMVLFFTVGLILNVRQAILAPVVWIGGTLAFAVLAERRSWPSERSNSAKETTDLLVF